jgi:hypothetical protein
MIGQGRVRGVSDPSYVAPADSRTFISVVRRTKNFVVTNRSIIR